LLLGSQSSVVLGHVLPPFHITVSMVTIKHFHSMRLFTVDLPAYCWIPSVTFKLFLQSALIRAQYAEIMEINREASYSLVVLSSNTENVDEDNVLDSDEKIQNYIVSNFPDNVHADRLLFSLRFD
jgi:hypothetical protein